MLAGIAFAGYYLGFMGGQNAPQGTSPLSGFSYI